VLGTCRYSRTRHIATGYLSRMTATSTRGLTIHMNSPQAEDIKFRTSNGNQLPIPVTRRTVPTVIIGAMGT